MAKSIRELLPIDAVVADTLFEGVAGTPDPAGIRARRVRADQLEEFIAREDAGGLVEALIDAKVEAEKERIDALLGEDTGELAAAIAAEEERAHGAEETLAAAKANKIHAPRSKTLETTLIGETVGAVTFETSKTPAPPLPGMAGSLVFANNSRFEQFLDGTFQHVSAAGVITVIYTEAGGWTREGLDVGGSPVMSKEKAAGAAWRCSVFFKEDFDLVDVNAVAQAAYDTASMAAEEFMAEDQRNDQQDTAIAALQAHDVPLPTVAGNYVLNIDAAGNASYVAVTTAGSKKK
jgi:hypothetical protein